MTQEEINAAIYKDVVARYNKEEADRKAEQDRLDYDLQLISDNWQGDSWRALVHLGWVRFAITYPELKAAIAEHYQQRRRCGLS